MQPLTDLPQTEDRPRDPRRNLYLLFACLLLWGLGEGMFYIFQPLHLEELGADPLRIGTVLGASALMMSLGHIPFGLLGDKIGRRQIIWGSWVLGTLTALMMALAQSLTWYVIGLILYGLTICGVPSMSAYTTDARGRWSAGRALTFTMAGFNAGALFGPLIGGYLAERIGLRGVYFVAAGIFTVSTALIFLLQAQPVEIKPAGQRLWEPLGNRRFVGVLVLLLAMVFSFILPQSLAPNFLQNQRGLSFSQVGQLASALSLSAVVFSFMLGHLRPSLVFIAAEGLLLAFSMLILRGQGMLSFGLAYLLLGISRMATAMSPAMVRPLVHPAQMGLAYGMVETIKALGLALAPLAAGWLYARDPNSVYITAAVIAAAMMVLIVFLRPRLDAIGAELPENIGTDQG